MTDKPKRRGRPPGFTNPNAGRKITGRRAYHLYLTPDERELVRDYIAHIRALRQQP